MQEDHELPFISGSVLIPGGSRDEDPAKAGLIGIYGEAWRTSGAAKMDGDALDNLLEAKAAHIETAGDEDSTALSWDSPQGRCRPGFFIGFGLASSSEIQCRKIATGVQQQAATGIVRRSDEEEGDRQPRRRAKLVYGVNSPYTRQPELATIGAVTVDDLKAWLTSTLGGKLIVRIMRRLRSRGYGRPKLRALA